MKIISCANQKGGCGKTITSVSLAGALAASGKKVLFIDIDPQAHASTAFGISVPDPTKTTYTLFNSFVTNENIDLRTLMYQRYTNLTVVPSHMSLSTMELKMSGLKDGTMALNKVLKNQIFNEFDHIIIDTPPNLGFLTMNAFHASHRVISPIDVSLFSMRGVEHVKEILAVSKSMGVETPRLHFLITIYDGRSKFAKNFLAKAQATFGIDLLKTTIRNNIKLREAADAGMVIYEYDPKSNGAKDYLSLARELIPYLGAGFVSLRKNIKGERGATKKKVTFKLTSPEAKEVNLVGNFNGWAIDNHSAMKKLETGEWIKTLRLPEGKYVYKFVVDGKWIEDPNNKEAEINEFGGKNSRLLVV